MLTITFVCHARIKTSEVLSEWYHMYFLYLISSISWQTAYSSWCASFEMASDEISGVAWRTLKPDVCLSRVNQYNGTVCNLGRTHVTSWLAFFLWPSLTAHSEFSSEQIVHVCPLGRVFLKKTTDDNIKEWGRSKFPESCVRFHIGDQGSMRLKHTTVQYAKCLV